MFRWRRKTVEAPMCRNLASPTHTTCATANEEHEPPPNLPPWEACNRAVMRLVELRGHKSVANPWELELYLSRIEWAIQRASKRRRARRSELSEA